MKSFTYERARTPAEAANAVARNPGAKFIAGGTNLLDLMKLQIETPTHLVDVNGLKLETIEARPGPNRFRRDAEMVAERTSECFVRAVIRIQRDLENIGCAGRQRARRLGEAAGPHVADHRREPVATANARTM